MKRIISRNAGILCSRLALLLGVLCGSGEGIGAYLTQMTGTRITSCGNSPGGSGCDTQVYYAADGYSRVEVEPVGEPRSSDPLLVVPWGLHCDQGDRAAGFTGCAWGWYQYAGTTHAPKPVNQALCTLTSYHSWEVKDVVGCAPGSLNWGPHQGASPGAECVVWGQAQDARIVSVIYTVTGPLDATVVANSGGAYCVKAPPPSVTCEISLPGTIDHGQVPIVGTDTKVIVGTVDCGGDPHVYVLAGGGVVLGSNLGAKVTAMLTSPTSLEVTSVLTSLGADPGAYSGSVVVIVDPQ